VQTSKDPHIVAIDVAKWQADEEYPYFPEGSREKRLLRCPQPAPAATLLPGHRYQFKQSRAIYPEQFWAEIVAYHLGLLTGVPVPPAYPAWDSHTDTCAVLIEWFYGYPDHPTNQFLSGGLFMKSIIKDYDFERGRQHNFESIELLCEALAKPDRPIPVLLDNDWVCSWATVLTFDALIGNTDRHHENWGFLLEQTSNVPPPNIHLAPAFDNGTSLGHEFSVGQFDKFNDPMVLERYINRGRHHMRWRRNDAQRAGHAELLLKLAGAYPQCVPAMQSVLVFDAEALQASLQSLAELALPVQLSAARARFMLRLVLARRDHLLNALASP
jgi:hypothetical protein